MSILGNNLLAQYYAQNRARPYREVLEYIETDGTQYWDTEIIPENNIGVDLTYAYPTISGSSFAGVFGIYASLNPRRDTLFMSTDSGMTNTSLYYFHRGKILNINTIAEAGKFNHVKINYLNNNKIIVNDSLSADCGSTTIVSTVSLRISARYNYNNSTWACAPARIQVCRISQGDTIIHDYIPVLDYNGDACLYDKVAKTLLYHINIIGNAKPTYGD